MVVAATGYRERAPQFLAPLEPMIRRDEQRRLCVRLDYSVELDEAVRGKMFVSNAELHTHGVATPDLGVCAFRNATILNTILGREVYRLPKRTAYTSFAPPPGQDVQDATALDARVAAAPPRDPRVATAATVLPVAGNGAAGAPPLAGR